MEHIQQIANRLSIKPIQVQHTLDLLQEGCTIPFIARYRKEATGGLDEEQIRTIEEVFAYETKLTKRKEDVISLITTQGKMTEELQASILACVKLSEVEDIYRPYQQKKKTRATMAVALGLQPLANWLLRADPNANALQEAQKYVTGDVKDVAQALQGAKDIIAEMVSDDADIRKHIRESMENYGTLKTTVKKNNPDEELVYKMYYDYKEKLKFVAPHRIMAIERAEREKVITVSIEFDRSYQTEYAARKFRRKRVGPVIDIINEAVDDGLKRLVIPSVENEVRKELLEKAQEASIDVFSNNLEKLLLQTPMKDKMILGFDPAYRTGCKLALIDGTGKVLAIDVIYPHPPVNKKKEAEAILLKYLTKYPVDIVSIGNGTASRESEQFVAEVIHKNNLKTHYTMTSEAGASVYSASELARKEFPDFHVEQRSAVSIARRVLDPLSELIKIDPQSIGVGQYQHDLPTTRLNERLGFVVSKAVNLVGVNVNTASEELLKYISGLTATTAKAIVKYRNEHGRFDSREQLHDVPRLGSKSYEQAAGFLRIEDGKNFLDRTGIHPESYDLTLQLLKANGLSSKDVNTKACFDKFANMDASVWADYLDRLSYDWYQTAPSNALVSVLNGTNPGYKTNVVDPRLAIFFQKAELGDNAGKYVSFSIDEYRNAYFGTRELGPDGRYQYYYATINEQDPNGYFYFDNSHKSSKGNLAFPMLTYSETLFCRAELALRGIVSGDAKALFEEGVKASINEAAYHTANCGQGLEQLNASEVNAYVAKVTSMYGSDKEAQLKSIIMQKWIAIYPNSTEGWNEIRRTGYPDIASGVCEYPKLRDGALVEDGNLIMNLSYPDNEYNYNETSMPADYQKTGSKFAKREQYGVWWSLAGKGNTYKAKQTPSNF